MSVMAGLEEGGVATDPFEAAMEAKGVQGGGSGQTLSRDAGLTFADKPAAPAQVDTVAQGETEDQSGTQETPLHDDPEIAAYLERFGGDADKALAAAVEAQKMIGRQANEVGELRQQQSELKGRLDQLAATPPAPAAQALSFSQDDLEGLVDESGGLQAATWIANNSPQHLDATLRLWASRGSEEAYDAREFKDEYRAWLAEQNAPAQPAPDQTAQYVQQQLENERITSVMGEIATGYPDFEDFKEYLMPALEGSKSIVVKNVYSADPTEQKEALELVFDRARLLAQTQVAGKGADQARAAAEARKAGARVVTGQLRDAAAEPAKPEGERTRDEEIAAFKSRILASSSTSVADGLVVAKA